MMIKRLFWMLFSLACIAGVAVLLLEPKLDTHPFKKTRTVVQKKRLPYQKSKTQVEESDLAQARSFVSQYYYKVKSLFNGTFSWGQAKHLSLCSFSVKALSGSQRDMKGLQAMVDILRKYDLIALQGIRNEKSLIRVIEGLSVHGPKYAYMISPWVGSGNKDRFAFVYRKDKVRPLTKGRLYTPKSAFFEKVPYYASFKAGQFDFTVINVNIKSKGRMDFAQKEVEHVADLYMRLQGKSKKENDIIVVGHFDLPPEDPAFSRLLSITHDMTYLIRDESTLLRHDRVADNIFIPRKYVQEYDELAGVDHFEEDLFEGQTAFAAKAISSSRPVWARFEIKTKYSEDMAPDIILS